MYGRFSFLRQKLRFVTRYLDFSFSSTVNPHIFHYPLRDVPE